MLELEDRDYNERERERSLFQVHECYLVELHCPVE